MAAKTNKSQMNVLFNLQLRGTIFFIEKIDPDNLITYEFSVRIENVWENCDPNDKIIFRFLANHSWDRKEGGTTKRPTTTFAMNDTSYKPESLLHLIDLLRASGVGIKEV
jgi:hypothetical protein